MSYQNQTQIIQIVPLAPKEQEEFLCHCDKLYFALLQKNIAPLLDIKIDNINNKQ